MLIRSYKYKIRLNKSLKNKLEYNLESCRFLYNCALEQRISYYKQTGKTLHKFQQALELTQARKEIPINDILREFQTQTLNKLDKAYQRFFNTLKSSSKGGFPRFKSFERFNSISILDSREFKLINDKVKINKFGTFRIRLSRLLEGKPKTLTLKREFDGWYVSFVCETKSFKDLPKTEKQTGIDLGIENLATLSDGTIIENPKWFKRNQDKLAITNQNLSRKIRGSNSRNQTKKLIAKVHAKIKRQREWFHWNIANRLVKDFDLLVLEKLNIKNLVNKSHINKEIMDVYDGSTFITNFPASSALKINF